MEAAPPAYNKPIQSGDNHGHSSYPSEPVMQSNPGYCYFHRDTPYSFFCFDDKLFVCNACLKEHRKHDIAEKSEIEAKEKNFKIMKRYKAKGIEYVKGLKEKYTELIQDLNREIGYLNDIQNTLPGLGGNINSIYDLEYKEFSELENTFPLRNGLKDLNKKINEISEKFKLSSDSLKPKGNFHEIRKEIQLVKSTPFKSGFPFEIMVGRSKAQIHSIFDDNRDQFMILDLGKDYFIKQFKMMSAGGDCIVKNFSISVQNDDEQFERVGKIHTNKQPVNLEERPYDVGKVGRFVRIDLHNTYGSANGPYIIVCFISFIVSDLE